jgi:hypothetical protein
MPVKLDKHDIIFSKVIRERNDWNCESCGMGFRNDPMGLHCSHYIGRSNRAVRWDCDNASAHCGSCHHHFGMFPGEHVRWYVRTYGDGMEQIVTEKARKIRKWKKWDKAEMYAHYKAEYKRLTDLRAQGVTGWIDVVNFA